MSSLRGQRVLVMGLGLFGGGVGATRFLVREGAEVTVTDLRSPKDLEESIHALKDLSIAFKLGGHDQADFRSADLIVANPAVPRSSPFLKIAQDAGVPITTEICLFVARCTARIVGVTGSSGKTTTTSLIGEMLKRTDPRTLIGGNLGRSLLDELDTIEPDQPVVLEVSSFQLDRLGEHGWHPHIAVVTNFAPNHMDVHGSLDAYREAKKQIVKHQISEDWTILNADDAEVSQWHGDGHRVMFGLSDEMADGVFVRDGEIRHTIGGQERGVCLASDVNLPGAHNLANALAATGAAIAWGVSEHDVAEVVRSFAAVPHRLERVAEHNGIPYINDSIATSPDRTRVALKAFDAPIILIAGGYDKGIAFDDLGPLIGQHASHAILMGETGEKIAASIPSGASTILHRVSDLSQAVTLAADLAQPGDVVLLSPASASYDQFRNFEERGACFKALADQLVG